MAKRTPKSKKDVKVESEPSYIEYKLKTTLAYYISSLRNKNRFLDSFIKNNSHSKSSEAEFISRTRSDIKYLERHLSSYNSFSGADPTKLPKWLHNGTFNHFFSWDIVRGYKDGELTDAQLLYLQNWEIPLDDTVAAMLIGHGNLRPLIMEQLEKGKTEIDVYIGGW